MLLSADHLVVGAGASGLAFTDTLIADPVVRESVDRLRCYAGTAIERFRSDSTQM